MKIKSMIAAGLIASLLSTTACANPVRNAIFRPPTAALSLENLPLGSSFIEVETSDKLKLKGIYVPPKEDKPIILVFHGNASSASGILRHMTPIANAGYGIISTEWRGYSQNPGSPSQEGVAKDADAFLAYAKSVANGRKIIVFGHSLGGAVSLDLAQRHRLDFLVTYGTIQNVRTMTPVLARPLIRDPFDNYAAVRNLDEPFVLVHGLNDETIEVAQGVQLVKSANEARTNMNAIFIRGGRHSFNSQQILQIFERIKWGAGGAEFQNEPYFDFSAPMPVIK